MKSINLLRRDLLIGAARLSAAEPVSVPDGRRSRSTPERKRRAAIVIDEDILVIPEPPRSHSVRTHGGVNARNLHPCRVVANAHRADSESINVQLTCTRLARTEREPEVRTEL